MRKILLMCVFLPLLGGAAALPARAQNAKEYERQMQSAVRKLTKEIKATASGKYLVRFETSDATTALYFKPTTILWRKLSDAERRTIAEDWWRRWRKIPKPNSDSMNEIQSLDGKKDVYCSLGENGVDPVCEN